MNAYENTDKEIWRKIEGDYYSPRIFVTKEGNVGISVGGNVYVQSVEEWHKQADRIAELEKQTKPLSDEEINEISMRCYVYPADGSMIFNQHKFARAIEERHGIK